MMLVDQGGWVAVPAEGQVGAVRGQGVGVVVRLGVTNTTTTTW